MAGEVTRTPATAPLRQPSRPLGTPGANEVGAVASPRSPSDTLETRPAEREPEGNAVQRFFGGLLSGAGKWGTKAIDWYEDTASSLAKSAAATVKDVPILGSVAQGAAWLVEQQAQLGGGLVKGAGTLVGGVANMIVHPVDTVKGLYSLAEHIPLIPVNPLRVAHAAYDVVVDGKDAGETFSKALNPLEMLKDDAEFGKALVKGVIEPYGESIAQGKYAEAVGRGIFDIGSIVLTAGGGAAVSGGSKVGQVAGAAGRAAEIAGATGRAGEVASVAGRAGRVAEVANVGRGAEVANAGRIARAGKASEAANAGRVARAAEASEVSGIWRVQAAAKPTRLSEGIEVAVRRSSGVMDEGWRVEGRLSNGRVRVAKPGVGYKDISHAELVKANPSLLEVPQGTSVSVQRSSGAIEAGWHVKERLPNGNYSVQRTLENGKLATKEISPQALLEQNPALADGGLVRPAPVQAAKPAQAKPLTEAEKAAGLQQGFEFRNTDRVASGTPIKNGYVDGGGSMKMQNGQVTAGREIVVVDTTRDAMLAKQVEWARSLRALPEEQRLQALMKYVDDVMSPGGSSLNRNAALAGNEAWVAGKVGQEVLLGEVGQLGGGVCRHRSLLFKVLGDEAGLSVDLVRGQLEFAGGAGRHAWNEVTLANGRKVVVDIMNPSEAGVGAARRYVTPELADAPYHYVHKQGSYGQVTGISGH